MTVDNSQFSGKMRAGLELQKAGKARVAEKSPNNVFFFQHLSHIFPESPLVHVIRDGRDVVCSLLTMNWIDPKTGQPIPGVAPAAIQMGKHVAMLIRQSLVDGDENTPCAPFHYHDKGSMATIGRNRAVASVGGRQFGGFFAWLCWGVVHIIPLIGFRNKMSVVFSWLWSYFSMSKNARLITGRSRMKVKQARGVVSEDEEHGER